MISRLSKAPVIASALAIVIASAGYAFSQNEEWSLPGDPVPGAGLYGPPVPESVAESEPPTDATNVDAEDTGADPEAETDTEIADSDEPLPDVARLMLQGGREADEGSDIATDTSDLIDDSEVADSRAPEIDSNTPDSVRTIALPRRDDAIDTFGQPVDEGEDTYQLAALPSEDTSELAPESQINESLVPPIPAPAYRRPISSFMTPTTQRVQQADVPLDPTVVLPSGMDTVQTGSMVDYRQAPVSTGPVRLDRINSARQQPYVVSQPQSPHNIFMSDWVEVDNGDYRRIVGQ